MGMTLVRWSAGVALVCAAVAMALLPLPPSTAQSWSAASPAPLASEIAKFAAVAGRADESVRAYRAAQGIERWRVAGKSPGNAANILIDRSVPTSVAAAARAIAAEQWSALGATASPTNAQIFIVVDSTTIRRTADAAGVRRPLEPRRLVDVAFALPEATDGARCVTLVRLRGVSPAHIAALSNQSLLGVCGFFAAFGLPGEGIRQWLTATGYRTARRSDWHVARAPAVDAVAVYGLGEAGGRCLTNQPGACVEALGPARAVPSADARPPGSHEWVIDGALPATVGALGAPRGLLGDIEPELLLSAVRELGADRFGRFWRSSGTPAAAFESAFGTSLDSWTYAWVVRIYGRVSDRPTTRLRDVAWVALALPLLVVVAARRRERVLSERFAWARV